MVWGTVVRGLCFGLGFGALSSRLYSPLPEVHPLNPKPQGSEILVLNPEPLDFSDP